MFYLSKARMLSIKYSAFIGKRYLVKQIESCYNYRSCYNLVFLQLICILIILPLKICSEVLPVNETQAWKFLDHILVMSDWLHPKS